MTYSIEISKENERNSVFPPIKMSPLLSLSGDPIKFIKRIIFNKVIKISVIKIYNEIVKIAELSAIDIHWDTVRNYSSIFDKIILLGCYDINGHWIGFLNFHLI